MADAFAANGYLVIMPDILDKDSIPDPRPEGFSLAAWLGKDNHKPEFVQAVVDKTLAEIKKDFSMFEFKLFLGPKRKYFTENVT